MRQCFRFLRTLECALAAVGLALVGSAEIAPAPSSGAAVTKTTVTFAEPAGEPPNYIFPFFTSAYYTQVNMTNFQFLMFRPLYFFGSPNKVTYNEELSLADPPVFSNGDKTVKITLKTYQWSNGTKVDATDVMFWMNLYKMKPTASAFWFPGGLSMPTSVTSVKITSPKTLTFTFDRSFNTHWLFYDQLAEITPLPLAWTKTSPTSSSGSAGCATAAYGTDDSGCKAVYTFLSEQSGFDPTHPKTAIDALPTYASNPLWKVVDGPWELTSFGPTAPVVFKSNTAYSGPNKPKIKKFIEEPFTTDTTEFNALATGAIDYGYLPVTDITSSAAKPAKPGKELAVGNNNPRLITYSLQPLYWYAMSDVWYNLASTGDTGQAGAIFSQLYIRQAIQHLVDQTLYVNRIYKGYGYPDYGPVPTLPPNPFASRAEKQNPYPYSVSAAKRLLASHGWKVAPGGTSTCQSPGTGSGHCGKGIKKGAKLALTLQYASGNKALRNLIAAEKASWSQAGINVAVSSATYNTVFGNTRRCSGRGCTWELQDYDTGWSWLYSPPVVYPTGEEDFATGAESNFGSFNTPTANRLVLQSLVSNVGLTKYENYIEKELPGIFQPVEVTLYEIRKGLEGASPLDPLTTFTPATFQWK